MLTAETKRTIDAARDVLVGKVPDPKAQVEQITTALIYKFMHDLDQESVALGGKTKYFSGDYEQFAWSSLLDTRLSGEARLDLYVRAVTSLERNPSLPQLFRDIFKGAFLPYNDPQTLTLFLKEINKFTYSHSEELGNAFEYLLSVLGSQGDAGQFRTPRHIIDFMVQVIDPHKHETILDPACGTAGFLISAHKHIFRHNSSAFKPEGSPQQALGESAPELILADSALYSGDQLTPDERQRLTENIQGYDISPDMVRLSLVNLYLHGFPNPRIQEYDTLTSEQNWDQTFDVILANPPFMTPKGGIRPHRRFQVQAKRSEVLFVDYILEHLNPQGRAAVIVPEGVIFKSENAYKTLRRLLLDDGLYAVVSLPPGVFNPYSGVKTSILFFDMQVGKRADELLFVKIEQDGFDLGAQRRKIEQDDLPQALRVLRAWQRGDKVESPLALWAEKTRIAADGDYNLSAERYRPVPLRLNQKWPLVELGDEKYFMIESGGTPNSKKKQYWDGDIPWITLIDLPQENKVSIIKGTQRQISKSGLENSSAKIIPENSVIVSSRATIGRIGINKIPLATNQGFKSVVIKEREKIDPFFLALMLFQKVDEMIRMGTGGTYKEISKTNFSKIQIPLPPIEVQRDIVEQIQVKQDAIDAARALIASLEKERRFFARELQDREDVQWVELRKIARNLDAKRKPVKKSERKKGKYPYYGASGIVDYVDDYIFDGDFLLISEDGANLLARSTPIAFSVSGKIWVNNHAHILEFRDKRIQKITEEYINSIDISNYVNGAAQPKLNQENLNKLQIPIPSDKKIVVILSFFEKIQNTIISNLDIISLMEKKIEQIIDNI